MKNSIKFKPSMERRDGMAVERRRNLVDNSSSQVIIDRLVDMKTVCSTLSRSRASIYRDIVRGDFPAPVKCGRSSRWRVSDLNQIVSAEMSSII